MVAQLVIRDAEQRDAPQLGKLGAMLMRLHYAFDPQRFLAPVPGTEAGYASFLGHMLDAEDDHVFVAEKDGEIVGYIFVALEPLSWKELRGPAGFIHDIAVAEHARKSGIGTKLMEAGVDWLRTRGAPRVILWTAASNHIAHSLFKHIGFRETMTEMTMEL